MPIINPPETVMVDTGQLATLVHTIHGAHWRHDIPFRREVLRSALMLRESLLIPTHLEDPTLKVNAEELWWCVNGADDLGNDLALSPIGAFFSAVDDLGVALLHQAPRTDRGMTTALEAEAWVEMAAHTDEP